MSAETRRSHMPNEDTFKQRLQRRNLRGGVWSRFFSLSLIIAILALFALFFNIVNQAFGYAASVSDVNITELTPSGDLGTLSNDELVAILTQYQERRLAVYIRDNLSRVDNSVYSTLPISESLTGSNIPEALATLSAGQLTTENRAALLVNNLSQDQLIDLVQSDVIGEDILEAWSLSDSLFNKEMIDATVAEEYPEARLYFRSWLSFDFLTSPGSSDPIQAGIRTALLGTIWVVGITILFAFPIGVGAAIYLEEYAVQNRLNRLIETNIRNLAGVPSIIYGLLGLAILVRSLSGVTGGRTILSAGLTLALLILPVIIINSQEALRAVPSSIREASLGLGATKWQTIWKQVLPSAMPGVLTGTILALSRAVGETAPLVVIGASTFIVSDPSGPLSQFTALPIQIYQWTARPQAEYRDIAAAAIIVLMVLLLSLNATAIILRQRFRKSLQG